MAGAEPRRVRRTREQHITLKTGWDKDKPPREVHKADLIS